MGQPSGFIPERPGTGLVRWSARLVLFLLAAGLLLLLGEGHASAASSEARTVAVSVELPQVTPARTAGGLVSTATRAASRRAARPADARGRTAVSRRHLKATASASVPATRSFYPVARRAGRQAGNLTRAAGRNAGQVLGDGTRRVGGTLAPVKRTLEPILGPITQPVHDVLEGPIGPVDLLPDPGDGESPPATGANCAPPRTDGGRHSPRGGPVAPLLVAATGGLAGWLAGAGGVALDGEPAKRAPSTGKTVPATGVPVDPAPAQTTRDVPNGSLASAMLLLFLLLLWSIRFGRDGTRHRARPPLLFPA
jgi:hypothetical protein